MTGHLSSTATATAATDLWCSGPILEAVQRAVVFKDSKDFVDSPLREGLTQEDVCDALGLTRGAAEAD